MAQHRKYLQHNLNQTRKDKDIRDYKRNTRIYSLNVLICVYLEYQGVVQMFDPFVCHNNISQTVNGVRHIQRRISPFLKCRSLRVE